MSSTLPTGIVAFLFTDVEGSTPLWEREPQPMRQALSRHDAILRQAVESRGGQVFKVIGDAIQAAFALPSDALAAALDAQRALAAATWPTSAPLHVRMGLHVGPAEAVGPAESAGPDYATTHTLNRVARIMAAAHGGQTVLSSEFAELVQGDLPAGATLRDLGQHRMKGLSRREHLYQLVAPDLRQDFPALETVVAIPHNLPAPLSNFIGRERELAQAKTLLASKRLLTLTGVGGAGKTRLALQLSADVLTEFEDGAWFIELAPLTDPALVPSAVATAMGFRDQAGRPMREALLDYLSGKALLLILDNCEHLIAACAQLAGAILRACPRVRVLATSREGLGISGETLYAVPSLSLPMIASVGPGQLESVSASESGRLFVERGQAVAPQFALTAQNAAAIAQICRRLDGIPLAIELAAARVKALSPEQIARRLDDRFRLLTGGDRTALPRQQTLRAMIDWSYSLLSEPERVLFKRLAVFVGGWTLEAAEVVCSGDGIEPPEVLDLLTRLVDKSLVVAEEAAGETRYSRLETIRQYAREKLAETDEVESVRDRHLAFYVQFSEMAEEHIQGREGNRWSRRLEAEQDNLRAALEWGLASRPDSALRVVGALGRFWSAVGYSAEAIRWTQQALDRVEATTRPVGTAAPERLAAKAKALCELAWSYQSQGDNDTAHRLAEQSIALYRRGGNLDKRGLAYALTVLAQTLHMLGRPTEAEAFLQESIALARAANDVFDQVWALSILVRVKAVRSGDLDAARGYAEEGIRLSREAGLDYLTNVLSHYLGLIAGQLKDAVEARLRFEEAMAGFQEGRAHFNILLAKSDLAHLERKVGNDARALELYRETIIAFRDVGQRGAVAHQLECFAFIDIAQQHFDRAVRLLGAAEAWREQAGTPMTPDERTEYDREVAAVRAQLEAGSFTTTWAAGRTLTMDQAVAYALRE